MRYVHARVSRRLHRSRRSINARSRFFAAARGSPHHDRYPRLAETQSFVRFVQDVAPVASVSVRLNNLIYGMLALKNDVSTPRNLHGASYDRLQKRACMGRGV